MRFAMSMAVVLVTAFISTGCSSTKFRNSSAGINNPSASRLSILSINTNTVANAMGIARPPGNVWLDGRFMGDFTTESPVFSEEVAPGTHYLEVCGWDLFQGNRFRCLSASVNVPPNMHLYYEFKSDGNSNRFSSTKSERYTPQNSQPIVSTPAVSPTTSTLNTTVKKSAPTGMDDAKKKCIELGFKVGTESFGNCVLKVAN